MDFANSLSALANTAPRKVTAITKIGRYTVIIFNRILTSAIFTFIRIITWAKPHFTWAGGRGQAQKNAVTRFKCYTRMSQKHHIYHEGRFSQDFLENWS